MFRVIACSICPVIIAVSPCTFQNVGTAVQCLPFTHNKLNTEVCVCYIYIMTCVFHFLLLSLNLSPCKNVNGATIFEKIRKFCNNKISIQLCQRFCFELAKLSFYIIISYERVPEDCLSEHTVKTSEEKY